MFFFKANKPEPNNNNNNNNNIVVINGEKYKKLYLKLVIDANEEFQDYVEDLKFENEQLKQQIDVKEDAIYILKQKVSEVVKLNILVNGINNKDIIGDYEKRTKRLADEIQRLTNKVKIQELNANVKELSIAKELEPINELKTKIAALKVTIKNLENYKTDFNALCEFLLEETDIDKKNIESVLGKKIKKQSCIAKTAKELKVLQKQIDDLNIKYKQQLKLNNDYETMADYATKLMNENEKLKKLNEQLLNP